MKKSEIKTVLILAVVAALLACVLLFTGKRDTESAPDFLLSINNDSLTKIDFANGTDYVHLEKSNGVWKMSDDDSFNVDQDAVSTLIRALQNTKIIGTINIEKQSALEDYSLLSPQCIIEYTCSDGSAGLIRIGTVSSLTENLYVMLNEDATTVCITTNEIGQAFSCSKLDLLKYPDIPTPSDGHKRVNITNINGSVELYKDDGRWYIHGEDKDTEISDDIAYNYYYLTWDMHWRGRVEHNAEDLSIYGLSVPRISYALTYTDGSSDKIFELEFGSSLPNGTCYAKLKNSNDIFLLDSLMADWLENTKEEDFYELQK